MTGKRRVNTEGSIYPYPKGYRGYAWVITPTGRRRRKYVAAATQEEVLVKLQRIKAAAARGPVATKVPSVAGYLEAGWRR